MPAWKKKIKRLITKFQTMISNLTQVEYYDLKEYILTKHYAQEIENVGNIYNP